MTVKFTTVSDGVRHTRTSFSRALVCDTPDWVRAIGSSGGEHNLTTCVPCAVAHFMRQHVPANPEAEADFQRLSYAEMLKGQRADYRALTSDEYAFLTSKQSERIMRVAQFCPVRRIPQLLKEMHAYKALAMRQAATCPDVSTECVMRSILAQQAATVMFNRLREAVSDRVVLYRLKQQLAGLWDYTPHHH